VHVRARASSISDLYLPSNPRVSLRISSQIRYNARKVAKSSKETAWIDSTNSTRKSTPKRIFRQEFAANPNPARWMRSAPRREYGNPVYGKQTFRGAELLSIARTKFPNERAAREERNGNVRFPGLKPASIHRRTKRPICALHRNAQLHQAGRSSAADP